MFGSDANGVFCSNSSPTGESRGRKPHIFPLYPSQHLRSCGTKLGASGIEHEGLHKGEYSPCCPVSVLEPRTLATSPSHCA
eukprot:4957708-Pyramimonas_sp.AAC.1